MKRQLIKVVLFVMLIFLLAPEVESQQVKTLKIGETFPLTGPGSPWGLPWHQIFTMQAEKINAAGGITIGGEPYRIELIAEDDKCRADLAITAANKLIFQDKVKFLFGPTGSAAALAVNPIAEANGVLHFVGCWTDKILGPDKPHTWRVDTSSTEIAPTLYQWIDKTYPQIKKWAMISPNDESGRAVAAACISNLKRIGKEMVSEEYYERGMTDFYPILTRMIAKSPDILDFSATPPGDVALVVKQVRELGFKGRTVAPARADVEVLSKVAGVQAAEGLITTFRAITTGPLADPKSVKLKEEFIARWGANNWVITAFNASDMLSWLLYGVRKANSIDPVKVQAAMEASREWENPLFGHCRWGGKSFYGINRQQLSKLSIVECRNGKEVALGWYDAIEPVR